MTLLALRSQAQTHLRSGRLTEAEAALHAILRAAPDDAEALGLLGVVALQAQNIPAALSLLLPAAARLSTNALTQYNAAVALVRAGRFGDAAVHLRRAVQIDPQLGPAWNNLGNILKAFGQTEEATACYAKVVTLHPNDPVLQSHRFLCAHYTASFTHHELFEMHRHWAEQFAAGFYPTAPPAMGSQRTSQQLTVGLVSPSFNGKIVGQFLRGILGHLRAEGLRLHAYSATRETDEITAELRQSVDLWRDIVPLDDAAAARQIVADQVDILIDLAGHAPGNRLLVFARKPAPIQVSWLDYFNTTGLATIDYLLTDPRTTPVGSPQRFSERLWYLPQTRLCWTAPDFAPEPAPAPSLAKGVLTFGSFNRADKLNPALLSWWAQILRRVEGARLMLKGAAFGMPEIRRHFSQRLAALGVAPERIEWRGASSHAQLLAEYGEVDIALDTFPYNGGATTCDALWMGVPVVALRGERMIARQSAAMLECIDCKELIADSFEQYVEGAVALANDVEQRIHLRQTLRSRMASSPLCDARRFAHDLASALRAIWRAHCTAQPSKEGVIE